MKKNEYVEKINEGRLKYRLKETLIIQTNLLKDVYYSGFLVAITDDEIAVFSGFKWDGATGIHDGKKDLEGIPLNWQASCLHDVLIEEKRICREKGIPFPLTEKQIDKLFHEQVKPYWYRNIWYQAVRLWCELFRRKK